MLILLDESNISVGYYVGWPHVTCIIGYLSERERERESLSGGSATCNFLGLEVLKQALYISGIWSHLHATTSISMLHAESGRAWCSKSCHA